MNYVRVIIWESEFLGWDAVFKMTKNAKMYKLFEKGKRGQIFYISNRYRKDNKYLKSFDQKIRIKIYYIRRRLRRK